VEFQDGYLLKGRVDNNRFGYSKREFYVFLVNGEGIHIGLSALWDCVLAGHASLSAKAIKDSVQISMDGQDFGKFRSILKEKDNPEFFVPFVNMLRQEPDEEVEGMELAEEEEQDEEDQPVKRSKRSELII